jgi:hypothetical protein
MDQKTYPNLNPKMKEAYDRIMGTATTTRPPAAHEVTPKAPLPHQAAAPAPQNHHAAAGHLSHIAYNASMAPKSTPEKSKSSTAGLSKESLLLPILLAAGGVIFFVVYAIFWLNFFGMTH